MPGLEIRYLGFNTDDPSVKNKAVRQALAQAIDRSQLVSKVYGQTAEPLFSLIPTSIAGHTTAPSTALVSTPTPQASASCLRVTHQMTSQWSTGFQVQYAVVNCGTCWKASSCWTTVS